MISNRLTRKAALAFLACSAAALTLAVPAAQAQPAQRQSIAPIAYTSRTLPNGLRVYGIRDPRSSNVSVQVWYDVGSEDDPRGRSGFAHLFEHLMFKSTRNLVPEQLDRLTEDVGGFNNASTADDYTNYYEVVPANHLERLLWAEAERMGSLVVEPGFFASERDVVKEEYRSRVLATPYGRMFYQYLPQMSYDVHPYARPGIGSIEDLDAATIDDVRAFHATYYRPDNAVLVVAGNFDQAQFDRWVDRYFTPIRRPTAPIPRVTAAEPQRTAARRLRVYEPNTPLPAVMMSFPLPPASHPDAAALELLDGILSTGESSRLHQALIYRNQVASQTSSFAEFKQGPGVLAVYAILASGQTTEAGEAALRAEVARLRDQPVTAVELEEARNELITAALRQRETVDGRASALAEAVIMRGGPRAADERLRRIAAVTPADIQRVARRYLSDERSAALHYLPEEMQAAGPPEDRIGVAPTVQVAALTAPADIRIVQPAPEAQRVQPPAPGRAVVPEIPAPVSQRLANGLTIVTVEDHDLPLVTAGVVVGGGSGQDPRGRAGLAGLTAALITEGTSNRSATEIDQAAEALGSSIQSGAEADGMRMGMTVGSADADRALAILADVARNATLSEQELERRRSTAVDAVAVQMRNPGAVARMAAIRALYGEGRYGSPASGTATSLRAITRDDVLGAYRAAWTPANATLVLTGDITPAQARRLAERHFGSWAPAPGAPTRPTAAEVQPAPRPDVLVIDMPGSGQAAVAVVRNTLSRRDPRYYQALVANAVLGGGYSARLNQEIRIRRGLAYGAGSTISGRRGAAPFAVATQTRNDAAPEVLGLILAEMQRLGAQPVSASELDIRRTVLTGEFGRTAETTRGLAELISSYVLAGVGPEEIGRYQRSLLAVTPAQAQQAASGLLAPAGSTMVIVGDAQAFIERLRRERTNVTVIPIADLNLDSPSLR